MRREDEEPERPRATVNPAATALSDPATPVPAGAFGVVKLHSGSDTPPDSVLVLRIGKAARRGR